MSLHTVKINGMELRLAPGATDSFNPSVAFGRYGEVVGLRESSTGIISLPFDAAGNVAVSHGKEYTLFLLPSNLSAAVDLSRGKSDLALPPATADAHPTPSNSTSTRKRARPQRKKEQPPVSPMDGPADAAPPSPKRTKKEKETQEKPEGAQPSQVSTSSNPTSPTPKPVTPKRTSPKSSPKHRPQEPKEETLFELAVRQGSLPPAEVPEKVEKPKRERKRRSPAEKETKTEVHEGEATAPSKTAPKKQITVADIMGDKPSDSDSD